MIVVAISNTAAPQAVSQQQFWENMLWVGGAVLAGLLLLLIMRHYFKAGPSDAGLSGAFSLEELRRMRDRGEITITEYEKLKKQAVTSAMGSIKSKADASGADPPRAQ